MRNNTQHDFGRHPSRAPSNVRSAATLTIGRRWLVDPSQFAMCLCSKGVAVGHNPLEREMACGVAASAANWAGRRKPAMKLQDKQDKQDKSAAVDRPHTIEVISVFRRSTHIAAVAFKLKAH
jgi:hypothetical protein